MTRTTDNAGGDVPFTTVTTDLQARTDLANAQGIPAQFLVDILSDLRADRLVRSHRGRDGGYELGLPADQLAPLAASQPLALRGADGATAPWPPLDPAAGKYGRGRLLVVAGSPSYPGAAQLCLQGASASGCGSLEIFAKCLGNCLF
jgi:hypothetical protein